MSSGGLPDIGIANMAAADRLETYEPRMPRVGDYVRYAAGDICRVLDVTGNRMTIQVQCNGDQRRFLGSMEVVLCRNCGKPHSEHAAGKCLYEPTSWEFP